MAKTLQEKRIHRARRVRAKICGSESIPRLSLFRSNKFIYAQLINDETGKTLLSISSFDMKEAKTSAATKIGEKLAELAKKKGYVRAVVDRGPYRYHGRIKAFVEGARKGGLLI